MDFFGKKFKTKSNPISDPARILNEKEYKCISLQAITSEVIKENNKKQLKNLIEETNGHLADIRILLEEENDVKIRERCQGLIMQFEETLVKLIGSIESENINSKGNESSLLTKASIGHPVPVENKQNKLMLNEVEEKLKAMRQKRLSRLSTFVNEQSKLSEQRTEEGKNLEFETAIKSLQQKPELGLVKKPAIALPKVNEATEKEDMENDAPRESSVLLASKKFLQNRNISREGIATKTTIESSIVQNENHKSSTGSSSSTNSKVFTGIPPKPLSRFSNKPVLTKSFEEKPVQVPKMDNIQEEKLANVHNKDMVNVKLSPVSLPRLVAENHTGDQKPFKYTPATKTYELLKPGTPKNSMMKILNKINTCVIDNNFEKSTEDITKTLDEPMSFPSEQSDRNDSEAITSLHKYDAKIDVSEKKSFEPFQNDEYVEMTFDESRDFPIKINSVETKPNLSTFGKHLFTKRDIDKEQPSNFGVDNPEYFAVGFKHDILEKPMYLEQTKTEQWGVKLNKSLQKMEENPLATENSAVSNPEYFEIEYKSVIPVGVSKKDHNLKAQDRVTKDYSRQSSVANGATYNFYQKRKVLKRLLNNWNSLSNVLVNDSDTDIEDIDDMLDNLEDVSDLVNEIQQSVEERLRGTKKSANDLRNGSKVIRDIKDKLNDAESDIINFNGLKRDAQYLQLSNQLSSYFFKVNEIKCSKNGDKDEVLAKINMLVTQLENRVRKNESMLVKILEEQVELLAGSKKHL